MVSCWETSLSRFCPVFLRITWRTVTAFKCVPSARVALSADIWDAYKMHACVKLAICTLLVSLSAAGCGTANLSAELPKLDAHMPSTGGEAELGSAADNAAGVEPAVVSSAAGSPAAGSSPAVSSPVVPSAPETNATVSEAKVPGNAIVGFKGATVVLYNDEFGNNGARIPVTALSVPMKIHRVADGNSRFLIATVEGPRWVAASEVVKSGEPN